ncbi:hypothetical protein [Succinivibrio sp.]|jgi:hypothetical protein|uniref:hypothetical protein n=1 Tax=Succinivibrio sp. TaxID=2053619 RepID=UPI00386F1EC0
MNSGYSLIVYNVIRLVTLYLFTVNAYASLPTDTTRLLILFFTTGIIMFSGYRLHKQNRYFPTMFTWSLGALPWAFFLEMRLLYGSFEIDMVKYVDKYSYSIAVYNSFRYVLSLFVCYVILKDLYHSIKNGL